MKKHLKKVHIILFLCFCCCVAGAETTFNQGISCGGGILLQTDMVGGIAYLDFPFWTSSSGFLRGGITAEGLGGNLEPYGPNGMGNIGIQLRAGGNIQPGNQASGILLRCYGFTDGICNLIGSSSGFDIAVTVTGGGGFEIQFLPDMSVFWEYGGGVIIPCTAPQNTLSGFARHSFGFRTYFK